MTQQAAPDSPLVGRTILLVDDEDIVRLALSRMLRGFGCVVAEAASPAAALAIAEVSGDEFAVVLTDVVMPGMNGRELAERLRADRPHLPVVFMSAYVPETAFPDGRMPERSRFLHKPFSRDELRAGLEAALAS